MRITIPNQTRAKKNSTRILGAGKRKWIGASKIYMEWEKKALEHLNQKQYPPWSGKYPIEVHFFLFRDSLRKWDIDNVFCGCLDVLQKVKIIEDDSSNHVIPVFAGWAIDKLNPRVELLFKPATKVYYRLDLCRFK